MKSLALVTDMSGTKCLLDNNHQVIDYDAACQIGSFPYDHQFQYIGDGVVFSVDSIQQNSSTRLSFYKFIGINNYYRHKK